MIPINRTFAPLQAAADELARCGMRHAVCCPGSRNAPLLLALAGEPRIETHSVLDERSAGFVALGIAKASGRPVAVACTSGTAAANLHPAVAEAREARVPLLVLTADRPPELRDVGAGQSIDQIKLFGTAVELFVEVGNHEPGRTSAVHHRHLACRAYLAAAGAPRPAPVHLNFPLREPLAPVTEQGPGLDAETWAGRPDGRPWVERRDVPRVVHRSLAEELAREVADHPRGALVVGATREDVAVPAARLAAAAGWPLLAEPTSQARCGSHDRSQVIAHYDALLSGPGFARGHRADLVIRIGDTPTSKPLRAWLEGARQVLIDPEGTWHEPTKSAEAIVAAGAVHTCDALTSALADAGASDSDWLRTWLAADAAVPAALEAAPDPFEPKAYVALAEALDDGATVFVSSSMPIRYVETYFPSVATPIRFLANRGANGIDGVVSSAVGAALATGERCYLLTGELALLHDLGGLVAALDLEAPLTILCTNNGGGGIFDFLPVSEHAIPAEYERLIATPREVSLGAVAALAGMRHVAISSSAEVRDAVAEPGLVELRADRADAVRLHRELLAGLGAERAG